MSRTIPSSNKTWTGGSALRLLAVGALCGLLPGCGGGSDGQPAGSTTQEVFPLRGVLRLTPGDPSVSGADLVLKEEGIAFAQPTTARADASGNFQFQGVRPWKQYTLSASLHGRGTVTYHLKLRPAASGAATAAVDVELLTDPIALQGRDEGSQQRVESAYPNPQEPAGRAASTDLADGAVVTATQADGPAFFSVSGEASTYLAQPHTPYGVYVLVAPQRGEPGWYVQFPNATVDTATGRWMPPVRAQIGDSTTPAIEGEKFSLCVVVARKQEVGVPRRFQVNSPQDLPGVVWISPVVQNLAMRLQRAEWIFEEGLQGFWQDWSYQSTCDFASAAAAHNGTRSIQATLAPHGGVSFGRMGAQGSPPQNLFDLSPYRVLSFWIHGGAAGGQRLAVGVRDAADHVLPGPDCLPIHDHRYLAQGTVEAGVWKNVRIPLVDLQAHSATIKQIFIQDATGTGQPTFYLDDVSLEP
ncbi:MAG: hypothetical protein QHJ73_02605 [Armatimonadota bacterium]|nr:hypothetical protein [Armatimonadota bacterium]